MKSNLLSAATLLALGGLIAHQTIKGVDYRSALAGREKPDASLENKFDQRYVVKEHEYGEADGAAELWRGRLEGLEGISPAAANMAAMEAIAQRGTITGVVPLAVEEFGPGNFGGRLRGLVVHATQTNRILAGSVSGGVWRSEDAGASWKPVADFLASTSVGNIATDPDQPNRVFVGTGEGFFNGDAPRGAGIFVSNDFGDTWAQLASTNNPNFYYVNRIARVPATNTIIAATRSGLWRSTDLGVSFTRVATGLRVDAAGYQDVKADPFTPGRLLAAHNGSASGRGPIPNIAVPGGGNIDGVAMAFGNPFPVTGTPSDLIVANDGSGTFGDACEAFPANALLGKIALVDRGNCNFVVKGQNVQAAGAVALIVVQNVDDAPFAGGAATVGLTMPSMMISRADGERLKRFANNGAAGLFADGFEDVASGTGAILPNVTINGPLFLTNYLARSTDGGANWTQLSAANGMPETNVSRMEIGWGPGGVAYAAASTTAGTTRGLWRSTDGGANFTQTASTAAFIERQGTYDLVVAVAPNDANKVYLAAVDQFLSTNGGATITKNTFWNPGAGQIQKYIHADQHVYAFKPDDPNTLYTGSDGGVQRTTNGGATFQDLNNGLNVAMPNNLSISPDGQRIVIGTQDNGSHFFFGSKETWIQWSGGDGGITTLDPTNSNTFYSTRPFGDLFGTNDLGATEGTLPLPGAGANANGGNFYPPITLDPNNANSMLVGLGALFHSPNPRSLASATFTQIPLPAGSGPINSAIFSPLDGSQAYAGTNSGRIFKVTGIGAAPVVTSIQGNLPLGNDVSQILIDPSDTSGNTIFVVLADYGNNRVFKSTSGGANWVSLHGDLPQVPAYAIAIDPLFPANLFVGTEIGTFYGRPNAGTYTWSPYTYGLPAVRTLTVLPKGNSEFYAAVYGRGVFKATRSPVALTLGDFVNDIGCDNDGNLDEGETAQLPVKIKNLTNIAVSGASLTVTSNNTSVPIIPLQAVPSIPAFGEITVNVPVQMVASTACPVPVTLTASISVAAAATLSRTYSLDQNTPTNATGFVDGAESANTLLSFNTPLGTGGWNRVSDQANTGSSSYFAASEGSYSEKVLNSPWISVTSPTANLSFALRYQTEGDATQRWDGMVLEARTRSGINQVAGRWIDIGASGSVAYDGFLFNNTAIGAARPAWSGTQLTWRTSAVNLASFNGQQVQLRFRAVSDSSTNEVGVWLDDIQATGVSFKDAATCDNVCN
jgi:hypothetical protein